MQSCEHSLARPEPRNASPLNVFPLDASPLQGFSDRASSPASSSAARSAEVTFRIAVMDSSMRTLRCSSLGFKADVCMFGRRTEAGLHEKSCARAPCGKPRAGWRDVQGSLSKAALSLGYIALVGCSDASLSRNTQSPNHAITSTPAASDYSRSPEPDPKPELPLALECPNRDAALRRVAAIKANEVARGANIPDASEIERALRSEGAPYMWPYAFTLEGDVTVADQAREPLRRFLTSFHPQGQQRCGVAFEQTPDGRGVVLAISVDALADLEPLPKQVRVGSWVEVNANVIVPATDAKFVVLGPRGAPKGVPTSFQLSHAQARFSADAEGLWLVQLVAETGSGPRPVLEAELIAGSPASLPTLDTSCADPNPVPPEVAPLLLFDKLSSLRKSEKLEPLERVPELDALAQKQAVALLRAQRLAHDLGSGDPEARVLAAGLDAEVVGENVAHARDVGRSHCALYRSPSHRANMLSPHVNSVGLGVARDPDGSIWVCQLFARLHR
ncbi:MAG TPA: CAP domain-containing protein [Polyangiaceae bacterium]|nr:CAP domain-containing protein [Polyangiaceae bacterium]